MQHRSELIHRFSMFLSFQDERRHCWVSDRRLCRNLEQVQQRKQLPKSQDAPWCLYWHQRWRDDPLALDHLTAYLQEACFWAAYRMGQKRLTQGSLPDLFQGAIARTRRVLKSFNPALSHNLHSYAEHCFTNIIKDQLRQSREMDACTPWGLLHRVSRRGAGEALARAGISGTLQEQYLLAWNCYRELYAPVKDSTRKLPQPAPADWEAMAQAYNGVRLDQIPGAPAITPPQLEAWLLTLVKAVRTFRAPPTLSVDAPLGDEGGASYGEKVSSEGESLLDELVEQEQAQQRQGQYQQLATLLQQAIAQLQPEDQTLLQLYYGEQRRQREIAEALGVKQYSISRKLSRVRQQLLKALLDWCQAVLHVSLEPSVLDSMASSLEDWLNQYYRPVPDRQPEFATDEN